MFKNQKGQGTLVYVGLLAVAVVITAAVILAVAAVKGSFDNRVTDQIAVSQLRALTGAEDVVIVLKSNDNWFFGHMNDVVYTLDVDGKLMGGRCVSDAFSPVICRVYGAGGGE